MLVSDSERLRTAAGRFVAFFKELSTHFVEREDLLTQIALSLVQREHTLMTGPPGTAKSSLAHAVLGRIVREQTGQPSLFARQFTESTVQTDLVGPIDFKTLMETGRTEHFTDEGMLGAVHAFLDEVFDGRDMLLRSTLNVLQERELKQGSKTTRGQIECALMTTNRYLAEILETSSETLLAFVDRIAFISFVPRGFAEPGGLERVLRIQVAGTRPPPLSAPLTIEDLDVLQAATESVFVSDALADRLAAFVASFQIEIDAARRADPGFSPTRYLSTRSIVRLGRMLRSICVYDWAFRDAERPLVATQDDFSLLRLGLLLSGPSLEQIGELLRRETDPREQRQLAIMQTEREIFDRCIGGLPPASADEPVPTVSAELLESAAADRLTTLDDRALLGLAHQLGHAATSGRQGASDASGRFQALVRELCARAFRGGLGTATNEGGGLVETLAALADLADDLEASSADGGAAARWLRARTLESVHQAMELSPTALGAGIEGLVKPPSSAAGILTHVHSRLRRPRELAALRSRLLSQGAQDANAADNAARWQAALDRLLEEVVAAYSASLRAIGGRVLAEVPGHDLARLLDALMEPLNGLAQSASALTELGGNGDALAARVVGPHIRPYVKAAFDRFEARDRSGLAGQIAQVLSLLESAGLQGSVAPTDLVAWSAEALLRSESAEVDVPDAPDYDSYRALREAVPRASLAYTLLDITLNIAPELGCQLKDPAAALARLRELLEAVPAPVRRELAARDVRRIDLSLHALERWFELLSSELAPDPAAALEQLVRSRFYTVTADESALARFSLEARLIRDVFPDTEVQPLLARLTRLEQRSWKLVQNTVAERTEQGWTVTLRGGQGSQ